MHLKRIFLVIVLCVLMFVGLPGGKPKPALACSPGDGAFPGLAENFKSTDIVIKSRVQEVDAVGQNAVVRIEQYYKGSGPEHVVITFNDPETVSRLLDDNPPTSCTSWYPPLSEGDTVFFLAYRTFDGSYWSGGGQFSQNYFIYQSAEQTRNVAEKPGDEDNTEKYTASQLAARLTQIGGKATPPAPFGFPIMRAPLRLTTKNGTRYLLPVDGGKPELIQAHLDKLETPEYSSVELSLARARYDGIGKERCIGLNCSAYSPSGIFQYNFDGCLEKDDHDAALISSVGTFAWWVSGHLFTGCKDTLIAALTTDANKSAEKLALYAQWSPDGRKLAYNDLKGLWLWEAGKKENNPRLVVPAGKVPVYARYFSPRGNYLAVSEGEKNYTLNLSTGVAFYDGLFSPTEEFFIAFGTLNPVTGLFPVILCQNDIFLSPRYMCRISDFGDRGAEPNGDPDKPDNCCSSIPDVRQIAWSGDYRFYAMTVPEIRDVGEYDERTPTPAPQTWDTRKGYLLRDFIAKGVDFDEHILSNAKYKNNVYTAGFAFVYDQPNRSLALLKNETTVMINDRDLKFTIGKDIDSPIVQIDWLPSLLYPNRAR